MTMNDFNIGFIGGLDGTKSKAKLNQDIDAIKKTLKELELKAKLDPNQVKSLETQLNTLKANLTDAKFSQSALDGMVSQINNALKGIKIPNVSVSGNTNVGQQIGNNIAQGVANGVAKATSTMKSFSQLTDSMKSIPVLFNSDELIDEKNTLNEIKRIYSEFGQVKITNKVFNAGELQSFKVNIEQVNGELKETRTFMMELSDNGKFFVFPDDTIKGTEKYVQHLNAAKNATNATGEALNAQNQRLAEQAKYYGKIKEETNHLYSLKQKLLSADELQTAELEKQIKSTKQRITYNNQQLDKKGLRDNSLEREINDLIVAREKQLALSNAKAQDVANTKAQAQAQKEVNAVLKEQQALQEKVDKIQLSYDNGHGDSKYRNRIQSLVNDFEKYGLSVKEAEEKTQNLRDILNGFKVDGDFLPDDELLAQSNKFESEFEAVKVSVDSAKLSYDKFLQPVSSEKASSLIIRINDFLSKNKAITKEAKEELEGFVRLLQNGNVNLSDWNKFDTRLKEINIEMREADRLGKTLSGTLIEGAKSFAQWTVSSFSVMEAINAIKSLISTSKELNSVATDFTMATGVSENQLKSLNSTYNKLADDLKSTTTDVMTSATEWIKQGQSISDTEKLIENAMVLDKVGKLDSADATKYLTSAMKGYKVAVEDTMSVVDKLSAVDMASATDVGGLAEGMSEVANNANMAGVSMDKLLGYLAVIGETTQSSMSEVGTSLNAVFSRMGNIKLARLKDYQNSEGVDLSNVETVLRGEGISLRETSGEFRNFGEVLDEVASNWTNYSEVSQRAIASAFAGVNHMENFLVLMSQYDKALKYTETSLNSTGSAMEKFSAYEKSVEAHTQSFTNAVQGLADTAVDSGLINFFIDLGTTGIKALDGLMEALTPLGTIGLIGGGILGGKNLGKTYECMVSKQIVCKCF